MDDLLDNLGLDTLDVKIDKPADKYSGGKSKKKNLYEDKVEKLEVNSKELRTAFSSFTYVESAEPSGEETETIIKLCKALNSKGVVYRFGAEKEETNKKILEECSKTETFLPWKKFNGITDGDLTAPTEKAYRHATYYHSKFDDMKNPIRAMIARDIHRLLGKDCIDPLTALLVYSEDASDTVKNIEFKKVGYVQNFMMRRAEDLNIPIFNVYSKDGVAKLVNFIKLLKED